jgi:hypothetical protein
MTRHRGLRISALQVPTFCHLEEKVSADLKKFANENHVPVAYVLNEAAKNYLGPRLSKAHTHKPDYLNGIGLTPGIEDIIRKIKSKGFDKETTQLDLQDAIRAVRGNDPRTLRNWMKSLLEIEFIKEKTRINWKQAIYVLNWSVVDESLWPDSIKISRQNLGEAVNSES